MLQGDIVLCLFLNAIFSNLGLFKLNTIFLDVSSIISLIKKESEETRKKSDWSDFMDIYIKADILKKKYDVLIEEFQNTNNLLRVYQNGVNIYSSGISALIDRSLTNNYIGRSNWNGDGYFNGSIAGLYVYNAVLSESQVQNITASNYDSTISSSITSIFMIKFYVLFKTNKIC